MMYLGKFIVEGYHFDWLPGGFDHVKSDGFSVRRTTLATADNRRTVLALNEPRVDELSYRNKRKITVQAWAAEWQSPNSPMDYCMYEHLKLLDELQKGFYIQFDDLMTHDLEMAATLVQPGLNYRAYFTPTWPIKPYGWSPTNLIDWTNCVFINNVPVPPTMFSVDEEAGMIQFRGPLDPAYVVTCVYTWRAYVQIAEFNLQPMRGDVPVGYYTGTIVFEQIEKPSTAPDYWKLTLPCMEDSEEVPSLSSETEWSIPSVPPNPTEDQSFADLEDSGPSVTTEPLDTVASNPSNASWESGASISPSSTVESTPSTPSSPTGGLSDNPGGPG